MAGSWKGAPHQSPVPFYTQRLKGLSRRFRRKRPTLDRGRDEAAILIVAISLGISRKSSPLHLHEPALCQKLNGRSAVARGQPEVAGLVNPEGWQTVAGGRRGLWGRRPSGNGAGAVLPEGCQTRHCGACSRLRVAVVMSPRSGTPPGCSAIRAVFRWSFPPLP